MKQRLLISIAVVFLNSIYAFGGNGFSNSTGNWNNPSTWLFSGSARVPTCGDTVNIPYGTTVTVNSQENLVPCGMPLHIVVGGILQFTNGNKLELPCGSDVDILVNGLIRKATPGGGNSTMISICNQDEWTAGDGDLPGPAHLGSSLPVSLLYFDAVYKPETVRISFATASELNNDYFLVQRSSGLDEWRTIERITGAGTVSDFHSYHAVDLYPETGINYYRLCQYDFDGACTFYPPVAVRVDGNEALILCDNPSLSGQITLLYRGKSAKEFDFTLTSVSGSEIVNNQVILEPGLNIISIPVEKSNAAGVYLLKVDSGTKAHYFKWILGSVTPGSLTK